MASTNEQARRQLLDALAQAVDDIADAVAALGAAYEELDEQHADEIEDRLYRPAQHAYGRAKRTHSEFAARHGLPAGEFRTPTPRAPSTGVKGLVEIAVESIGRAEAGLVEMQDSFMPVEFGDPELRAGLSEVRELIVGLPRQAREFVRTFGR
jgi:hypothetical protein